MPITLNPGEERQINVQMVPIHVEPEKAMLYGKVTDADTGLGIPNVHVEVAGPYTYGGYTDSEGNYAIDNIEPGTYTVTFTHADYGTVVV